MSSTVKLRNALSKYLRRGKYDEKDCVYLRENDVDYAEVEYIDPATGLPVKTTVPVMITEYITVEKMYEVFKDVLDDSKVTDKLGAMLEKAKAKNLGKGWVNFLERLRAEGVTI